MFGRLADRYDRFNRIASLGLVGCWRASLVRSALNTSIQDGVILDIGTGTAGLFFDFLRENRKRPREFSFIGIDFSREMLERAASKVEELSGPDGAARKKIIFIEGDARRIPIEAGSVDIIVSSFAFRNLRKVMDEVLAESIRVLRPGGFLFVLEMGAPENRWLRRMHKFFLKTFLNGIGWVVLRQAWSREYLSETILNFWTPDEFSGILSRAGFREAKYEPLSGGIAVLYQARK